MRENEPFVIGVIQTPVLRTLQELAPFLDSAAEKAAAHAPAGAPFFLLPELFFRGFAYDACSETASQTPEILQQLQQEAAQRTLTLGGSFWEAADDCYKNTFWLLGAGLHEPKRVRSKQRLFPLSDEERHFTAGSAPLQPFELMGLRCGLGICFELRFPEIFRQQAAHDMELLLLSSQWPLSRAMHLETLSRARAIENQCFLLSCNACGPSMLGTLAGGSRCISPWGEDLFACGQEPAVACAPCSLQPLERARAAFDTRPLDLA